MLVAMVQPRRHRRRRFALLLALAAASSCSDSKQQGSDAQSGPRACTAAESACLKCAAGFHCCTRSGACWDPVAQPNNCTFTPCGGAGSCDETTVCKKSSGGTGTHKVTVSNRTGQTIWIAALSSAGSLDVGGWDWKLDDQQDRELTVPHGWDSGRLWARTGCTGSGTNLKCEVGDCKGLAACAVSGDPPVSLAELTLDGGKNVGQPDNYDVSFVDGWNFQITIAPKTRTASCKTVGECKSAPACWSPGKWPAGSGPFKGCLSPCKVRNDVKHCCKCDLTTDCTCKNEKGSAGCCDGKFGCSPFYPKDLPNPQDQLCIPRGTATRPEDGVTLTRPESKWDDDALTYLSNVESACPDVYSWQFHDTVALVTCQDDPYPVDYVVTFKASPVQ